VTKQEYKKKRNRLMAKLAKLEREYLATEGERRAEQFRVAEERLAEYRRNRDAGKCLTWKQVNELARRK
jgi:hypothetical protein